MLKKMKKNMEGIHFLKGTGSNCSCNDCSVLYGGKCYTTPTNNFLDKLEKELVQYLAFTPKGKPRKVSDSYLDKSIEVVIKPLFCKFTKVSSKQFYEKYYTFMPLIFIMTSDKKQADRFYKRARIGCFWEIEKEYKELKK